MARGEASWLTAAGLYTGEYPSVWINKGTDSQAAGPDKKKEIGFFFFLLARLPLAVVCSCPVAFSGFRAKVDF